jgi:hypothetical protein
MATCLLDWPLKGMAAGATTSISGLPDLTVNKYSDWPNGFGKRFGRLKTKLCFESQIVFHSIRKIVVTIPENASVAFWRK